MDIDREKWFNIILVVVVVVVVVATFWLLLNLSKQNFCRCNSIGSRVICPEHDKEELNKLYVNGTLTENTFA